MPKGLRRFHQARSQSFTYDGLNRLATAETTASNLWGNSFVYDAWGNLLRKNVAKCSAEYLQTAATAQNRLVGYTYDAAGNMTSDGLHGYTYNAENQISAVDASVTYTYDANGNRVRKDTAPGGFTEYLYWGGNPIAEKNQAGDWTDYIYAGGRRIAKATNYENRLTTSGTNCADCGWQDSSFNFANAAGLKNYVIRSGDKLYLTQWQSARAGMYLQFTDGSNTGTAVDQRGELLAAAVAQQQWITRRADLSAYAGKAVAEVAVSTHGATAAGDWIVHYQDIALVSADGTVHAIFNGQSGVSLAPWGTAGVSNRAGGATHAAGGATGSYAMTTTWYYHGDHLGSARVMTGAWGYPVWQGTYLPFGSEYNPQITTNHYKFTGKERDSESGLDYFGARYYGSNMGRWLSPDWSAAPSPVPYSKLDNPQTLNLYSYVQNNPLSRFDDDGHATIEIRYTSIGPSYTHSYLVVTDTNGARTYFRAGPSQNASPLWITPATGGASSQVSGSGSSGSNSSNSSNPGSGTGGADANTGPFGALHADSGSYTPDSVDYETKPAASSTLLSNDLPAAGYINQLQQYSDGVNQANIPYNPLSTNSNAYATGAANSLGLTVPKPPVWAPGAGTKLPVPPPPPPPPKQKIGNNSVGSAPRFLERN